MTAEAARHGAAAAAVAALALVAGCSMHDAQSRTHLRAEHRAATHAAGSPRPARSSTPPAVPSPGSTANAFYAHGHRTPTQSDAAAMRADNTSAFNCRPVTGNPYRVSQHSYGNAIDINTVRNPYVVGSRVYPAFARTYLNRHHVLTGMITRRSVIARTMRRNGWPWVHDGRTPTTSTSRPTEADT